MSLSTVTKTALFTLLCRAQDAGYPSPLLGDLRSIGGIECMQIVRRLIPTDPGLRVLDAPGSAGGLPE